MSHSALISPGKELKLPLLSTSLAQHDWRQTTFKGMELVALQGHGTGKLGKWGMGVWTILIWKGYMPCRDKTDPVWGISRERQDPTCSMYMRALNLQALGLCNVGSGEAMC